MVQKYDRWVGVVIDNVQ